MMTKQQIKESLQNKTIEEIRFRMEREEVTTRVAVELFEALKVAGTFGSMASEPNVDHNIVMVNIRDLEDCAGLLPLFEYLDSMGFEPKETRDYPAIHNRDFVLTKDGVRIIIGCYFTDTNCRKVPVATHTEYRLECGMKEIDNG